MKILHTADWHLGKVLHEHPLELDQRHFLDQFLKIVSTTSHDAVIISGDIFDRSIPGEFAISLWNDFLGRYIDTTGTPLIAIAGNHDSATRLTIASRIIERSGVHIRGSADRIGEPVSITDADGQIADIWCVPFLYPGALTDTADEEHPDGRILGGQSEAFCQAVMRIRQKRTPGHLNVLAAHCYLSGGRNSDSERAIIGTAVQIDPSAVSGFDYVALGHLHRRQQLSDTVCYAGSPIAYSFSEAAQQKSLSSITLVAGRPPTIEALPLTPLRPMIDLTGTMDDLLTNPAYGEFHDAYVRITLSEHFPDANPVARLRARFTHLLEFRNRPLSTTGASVAASSAAASSAPSIEEDFVLFEKNLRGESGLSAELVASFQLLLTEAEKEEAR